MNPGNQDGNPSEPSPPEVNKCPVPSPPVSNSSPVSSPPMVSRCPIRRRPVLNPCPNPCIPYPNPCIPYPNPCIPYPNPCIPYPNPCIPYPSPCIAYSSPCAPVSNPCLRDCPPVDNQCEIWFDENLPGFAEMFLSCGQQPTDDKIYVMYHGTSYDSAKDIIKDGFKQSVDGMLGKGVYVTRDIEKAKEYPKDRKDGKVVLKLRVNVGKVKRIDQQGHPMQNTWHDSGYDSAWVPANCDMNPTGVEKDCVWDPMRIKVVGIASANPPSLVLDLEGLLHRNE